MAPSRCRGACTSISKTRLSSRAKLMRAGNRAALVARAQTWSARKGVAHVTGVSSPTLILWGGRDHLIPPALAQRFAADIPGARVVVFDDLGHVPQEEDPARTVAVVKAFLEGAALPGGAPVAAPGPSSAAPTLQPASAASSRS